MNTDRLEGNWKQFKGKIKEKWGKLTDDDLDVIAGKTEQLVGRVQERYGIAKEEAPILREGHSLHRNALFPIKT